MTSSIRPELWQKIGIIVSVAWITIAPLYQSQGNTASLETSVNLAYEACVNAKALNKDTDITSCFSESKTLRKSLEFQKWSSALSVSIVFIIFAWLAAYFVLGIWRELQTGVSLKGETIGHVVSQILGIAAAVLPSLWVSAILASLLGTIGGMIFAIVGLVAGIGITVWTGARLGGDLYILGRKIMNRSRRESINKDEDGA